MTSTSSNLLYKYRYTQTQSSNRQLTNHCQIHSQTSLPTPFSTNSQTSLIDSCYKALVCISLKQFQCYRCQLSTTSITLPSPSPFVYKLNTSLITIARIASLVQIVDRIKSKASIVLQTLLTTSSLYTRINNPLQTSLNYLYYKDKLLYYLHLQMYSIL